MWDEFEYDDLIEGEILIGINVLHETELAVLIFYNGNTAWFPKSIIINYNTLFEGAIEYDYRFDPQWKLSRPKTKMSPIEGDFE